MGDLFTVVCCLLAVLVILTKTALGVEDFFFEALPGWIALAIISILDWVKSDKKTEGGR
jgi:hypothetical protein